MAMIEEKASRLAADCSKAELRISCSAGRKWKCVLVNGKWRKQRCRNEVGFDTIGKEQLSIKYKYFVTSNIKMDYQLFSNE